MLSELLSETIQKLKDFDLPLNYVRSEYAHLTLAFFKNISEINAQKLAQTLHQKFASSPFEISLSLGSLGAFPDHRRPKVIWREVMDDGDGLPRLKKKIDDVLKALGLPLEDRAFKPHLTLARIREDSPTSIPESIFSMPLTHSEKISIQTVTLFKSDLTSNGPHYTVLSRIPFGRNPPD